MSTAAQQLLTLTGSAIGIGLASLALRGSRKIWRRNCNPPDLAISLAAAIWLLHLLTTTILNFAADNFPAIPALHAYATSATHVGYQALMVIVGFFLLTCAGVASAGVYLLLVIQAVAGVVALVWQHGQFGYPWSDAAQTPAYLVWIAINLLSITLIIAAIAQHVYLTRSFNAWLALAAGIIGLGLYIDDLLLAGNARYFANLWQYFYAGFLLVIWQLVTQPGGGQEAQSTRVHDFQRSSGFEALTGFGSVRDAAALAVANERRRIAQDLHDGVGSQIVTILSSLDSHTPQQQAVAFALEQCLVELKMTVDAIDSANDNVLEALGRLRYRMQHSLDKLGISLGWNVEICDELEAVHGDLALQALRIAQESLSNVMRHAKASTVVVVCRFDQETSHMILEVRDNGQGITRGPDGRATGKGLEGMRRRANQFGGELRISSKPGGGTRVRLTLPIAKIRVSPQPNTAWERATTTGPVSIDGDARSPHIAGLQ